MANPAFDFHNLTVSERLRLVGDIWDSIAAEASTSPESLPLSDAQKVELDRRLAEHDADPSSSVSLDESLARIRAQFRRPAQLAPAHPPLITHARRRIVFSSAADLEVAQAALRYDARQAGLGEQFLVAFETAATAAARSPQLYFRLHAELRRILVHRFPYALMFRDTDAELLIVSCYHLHDDPSVWQSRG